MVKTTTLNTMTLAKKCSTSQHYSAKYNEPKCDNQQKQKLGIIAYALSVITQNIVILNDMAQIVVFVISNYRVQTDY